MAPATIVLVLLRPLAIDVLIIKLVLVVEWRSIGFLNMLRKLDQ